MKDGPVLRANVAFLHNIPLEPFGVCEELLRQGVGEDRFVRHEESSSGLIEYFRDGALRRDQLAQFIEPLPRTPALPGVA